MIKVIVAGFTALILATVLAPGGSVADARSGAGNSANHVVFRNHRFHRFYRYAPYYYGYGYDDYDVPPPPAPAIAKAPAEKSTAEIRRGCEPQTYSVPSSSGGESKVTVLRC
jgi:hypothetical protein